MLSNTANFALTLIGAIVLVSMFDHVEPELANLRGNSDDKNNNASSSPIRQTKAIERKLQGAKECGKYYTEDSCNAKKDNKGNECQWCTDDNSNRVCVADISLGYTFAPCNNWICVNEADPSKSDLTSCERI